MVIFPYRTFGFFKYENILCGSVKKCLYFHRLNLLGKFKDYDFFEFNEIDSVKIGGGILQRPMTFQFKNKRKIKIKAQLKGVEKVAKLTPEVQQYIENNIAVAR